MNKLDLEKAEDPILQFQKNIYFCFTDYAKAFDLWITTNWNILKETGIPDHPYPSPEKPVWDSRSNS